MLKYLSLAICFGLLACPAFAAEESRPEEMVLAQNSNCDASWNMCVGICNNQQHGDPGCLEGCAQGLNYCRSQYHGRGEQRREDWRERKAREERERHEQWEREQWQREHGGPPPRSGY